MMGAATTAESRRRHRAPRDTLRTIAYLTPGMTGFLVFIIIPLIASLIISLFSWSLLGTSEFVGLDNYRRMISGEDPAFYTILKNTVVFALLYTGANLIISTGISYWLQHLSSAANHLLHPRRHPNGRECVDLAPPPQ